MNLKTLISNNRRLLARAFGQPLPNSVSTFSNSPTVGSLRRRTVLAIDASPSMDEKDWRPSRLEAAKSRAIDYVGASVADDANNEVAIIAYDERARLICPFMPCSKQNQIERLVKTISSGSYTNIAAALTEAELLLGSTSNIDAVEQLVHLLTDGWHNCKGDAREPASSLKGRGVVIDVVGIGGKPSSVDEQLLCDIASEHPGGGKRYKFIGDAKRLAEHYQRLAGRLTL